MKKLLTALCTTFALIAGILGCAACSDSLDSYGTLTIEDVTVEEGMTVTVTPVFSLPEHAETITYTFEGQNISANGNVFTGLVANTVTTVTAKTEHHETTFRVAVTAQSAADYGTLTIANVSVEVGKTVTVIPHFSVPGYAKAITYTFEGQNISSNGSVFTGLVANTVTTVTAKTQYHETTFTVTVLDTPSKLTIKDITVYSDYAPVPLDITFAKQADVAPIEYTIPENFRSILTIADDKVSATGVTGEAVVTVGAKAGELETTFRVTVTVYNGANAGGQSLGAEALVKGFLEKWEADGSPEDSVLFVGDSFFDIRWFWTNFYTTLSDKNAYCFGISSATTDDWDIISQRVVYPLAPKAIVIHCGTNNIFDDRKTAQEATADVERLLNAYLSNTTAEIYYFGIEPRVSGSTADNAACAACNEEVIKFCNGNSRLHYLDSPALCFNADGSVNSSFFRDGIHPTLGNYQKYLELLEEAGIEYEEKQIDRTIPDFSTQKAQNAADSTREIVYLGKSLTGDYILTGDISIEENGANSHIQFDFDGTGFQNRYLIWDSNSNGVFGMGWARAGAHSDELHTGLGEVFTKPADAALQLHFRIAVISGTAYFKLWDDSDHVQENSWVGVPAKMLRIGSEGTAIKVTNMKALTLADDPVDYAALASEIVGTPVSSIPEIVTTADQKINQTRAEIAYRNKPLTNNFVLEGSIEISGRENNSHISFDLNGDNNRYLFWDSNSNGTYGLGWSKGGAYQNEVGNEAFTLPAEGKLTLHFQIAVINGTAYFKIWDDAGHVQSDKWENANVDHLVIGTEACAARIYDMAALTAADDAEAYQAKIQSIIGS